MAEPCHYSTFESLLGVNRNGSVAEFGNLNTTLRIMRECWRRRSEDTLDVCGWRDVMTDLDMCVLLV